MIRQPKSSQMSKNYWTSLRYLESPWETHSNKYKHAWYWFINVWHFVNFESQNDFVWMVKPMAACILHSINLLLLSIFCYLSLSTGDSAHIHPLLRGYKSQVLTHYPAIVDWNPFDHDGVNMVSNYIYNTCREILLYGCMQMECSKSAVYA